MIARNLCPKDRFLLRKFKKYAMVYMVYICNISILILPFIFLESVRNRKRRDSGEIPSRAGAERVRLWETAQALRQKDRASAALMGMRRFLYPGLPFLAACFLCFCI